MKSRFVRNYNLEQSKDFFSRSLPKNIVISMKTIDKSIITILSLYGVFHMAVLLGFLPSDWVWGGKLQSNGAVFWLEVVALLVILVLISIVLMKNKILKPLFSEIAIKRSLLFFSFYFLLNTVGNALAETNFEKTQSIITLYLAYAFYQSYKN